MKSRKCRNRPVLLGLALTLLIGVAPETEAQQFKTVSVDVGARDPGVSPDGETIAVSILGRIWTVPLEGGVATPLTHGDSWDTRPAWSPDGRFLAYASRSGQGADLVVRTMATGAVRNVHRAPSAIGQIAFGSDGHRLYYVNDLSQYDAHVWSLPVAGGEPTQHTATRNWHEWSFAVVPGEDRLLLESGRYEGSDLYELDLEANSAIRLTESTTRKSSVVLSPDGSQHAYVDSYDGVDRIMVGAVHGPARAVHTSAYSQKQLAFHPDGSSLVVVAGRRLGRLEIASGELRPIPFEARFDVAADPEDDLAITNARLFDGTGDTVVSDATVVVRDGRIESVEVGGAVPSDISTVIDGEGRTLLPGLMDNHYHFWAPAAGNRLLAAGVTTIRDPGAALADALDYKDAIRLGILAGPDVNTAGPLLDGPGGYHPMVDITIETPAAAAPLVRALKAQGVDLLKAYFLLDPDVLAAVVAEARIQGLPVTGHIGVRTSWEEAIEAGINGFNHIRVWRDFLPAEVQADGRDESLDGGRNPVGRMQADWTQIDPEGPEVTALLRRLAETGTAIDPTLFVQQIGDGDRTRFPLGEFETARDSYRRMGVFVRRAVELGVPLLAGTDNAGLFNELEAYAEAGVPTAEILRAATVNGARWMGKSNDVGTVEPGKRAHLLLVDGDPLEDISALREIELVVKDGVIVFER